MTNTLSKTWLWSPTCYVTSLRRKWLFFKIKYLKWTPLHHFLMILSANRVWPVPMFRSYALTRMKTLSAYAKLYIPATSNKLSKALTTRHHIVGENTPPCGHPFPTVPFRVRSFQVASSPLMLNMWLFLLTRVGGMAWSSIALQMLSTLAWLNTPYMLI